ncbi:hypothetical protein [Halioxenophilus aromaticivorans]|uniref:GNAT family N-acetyltransferase n=1 Tax=Halioxenophilus aromaticivorans TaxID=1306992 RepID=A0AAV3TYN9_9ALTE
MDKFTKKPSFDLETITENNLAILQNLFRYYVYEFSHITLAGPNQTGNYDYRPGLIEGLGTTEDRFGFLIQSDHQLAGFALIRRLAPGQYDVDQFFITRNHTRKGLGAAVFSDIVGRYPGGWQVRVLLENHTAKLFWQNAILQITQGRFSVEQATEDGDTMDVYRFTR